MKGRQYIIYFFILLWSFMGVHPIESQIPEEIIDDFLHAEALQQSYVGFQVRELVSGRVIASFQDEKLFVPASTIKLFYTLGSVDQLGPEFRFITRIGTAGEIMPDGSLEGDLIIQASGDPSLGSARFSRKDDLSHLLAAVYELLQKHGIQCIDGNIRVESLQAIPATSGKWLWEDIGNYYAGGAWALNVNENEFRVDFELPGKAGLKCSIGTIEPNIPLLSLQNYVITGSTGSGDQAYIYGDPFSFHRVVRGSLPSGKNKYSIKGSIPNPPYAFALMLKNYLEQRGVWATDVQVQSGLTKGINTLAVHRSPTLINLAKACNDHSLNLYSEAFGKAMLGKRGFRTMNTYPKPEHWELLFSDYRLPEIQVHLDDACGLSKSNLISPNAMNIFLLRMLSKMGTEQVIELLPENGKEGTVRYFVDDRRYKDRLWLKSGSISGVLNYTGIYRSKLDNHYYLFSVFTNHSAVDRQNVYTTIQRFVTGLIDQTGK